MSLTINFYGIENVTVTYRRKAPNKPPCESKPYYSLDNGRNWLTRDQMMAIVNVHKQFIRGNSK